MMKVYSAKLGTQPALVQLRHKYGLRKGDMVLYRRVQSSGPLPKHIWVPVEAWQEGIIDQEFPYPHIGRNTLWLSKA